MATSLINTECKRYGCMKNLLACYANCRYSSRCEELKNEVENKLDQASADISAYLSGRGKGPITIQVLKRGLKFVDAPKRSSAAVEKPRPDKASAAAPAPKPPVARKAKKARKHAAKVTASAVAKVEKQRAASFLEKAPARAESRAGRELVATPARPLPRRKPKKKRPMARKTKNNIEANASESQQAVRPQPIEREAVTPKAAPQRTKRNGKAQKSVPRNGKVYIILDGKNASLVSEQELMIHLLSNNEKGARYFEATEVEARVQIVHKR